MRHLGPILFLVPFCINAAGMVAVPDVALLCAVIAIIGCVFALIELDAKYRKSAALALLGVLCGLFFGTLYWAVRLHSERAPVEVHP